METLEMETLEMQLPDGVFYRHWRAPAPRAAALLVHGLGEHSGRYRHVAKSLAGRGVSTLAPDHPGHGRSPGHRCHVAAFEAFYPALDALRDEIEASYPGLPCFLIGHSMGGLIAGNFLLTRQHRFAGAAFSAAAFAPPKPPGRAAMLINRLLAALIPTLGVMQLDAGAVSRDGEVVRRYREDPLVHGGKISAGLVVALFGAMSALEAGRAAISLPVLVMHGDGDVMTPASGSRHFHEGVGSEDRTLRIYPGLYHEIFNEPERAQVLGELGEWLEGRLPES